MSIRNAFASVLLVPFVAMGAGAAVAAPITYQWTADTALLSGNRDLLEAVTGQSSTFVERIGIWATTGGASGSFVYHTDVPSAPTTNPTLGFYPGGVTDWQLTLFNAAGVIGTMTTPSGNVQVMNAPDAPADQVFASGQCFGDCAGRQDIQVGAYRTSISGLFWGGGEFLASDDLPLTLPPPSGFTQANARILFNDGVTSSTIIAAGLRISPVNVPEPSTLALLALGLVSLRLLRRRMHH